MRHNAAHKCAALRCPPKFAFLLRKNTIALKKIFNFFLDFAILFCNILVWIWAIL